MSSYAIARSGEDVDEQLDRAVAWEEKGETAVHGMTYEQGVLAGIRWVVGDTEDIPVESGPESDDDEGEDA